MADFERKLSESDVYLQILIEQVKIIYSLSLSSSSSSSSSSSVVDSFSFIIISVLQQLLYAGMGWTAFLKQCFIDRCLSCHQLSSVSKQGLRKQGLVFNEEESLEDRIELCEDLTVKEKYNVIKVTAEPMRFNAALAQVLFKWHQHLKERACVCGRQQCYQDGIVENMGELAAIFNRSNCHCRNFDLKGFSEWSCALWESTTTRVIQYLLIVEWLFTKTGSVLDLSSAGCVNIQQALETPVKDSLVLQLLLRFSVLLLLQAMIESIKHTIVMLQITKESLKGPVVNSTLYDLVPAAPRIKIHPAEAANSLQEDNTTLHNSVETATEAQLLENDVCISQSMPNINIGSSSIVSNSNSSNIPTDSHAPVNMKRTDASSNQVSVTQVPDISYSSSEDEDFYDAEEYRYGSPKTTSEKSATSGEASPMQTPAEESPVETALPRVITSEDDIFDAFLQLDALPNTNHSKSVVGAFYWHGPVKRHWHQPRLDGAFYVPPAWKPVKGHWHRPHLVGAFYMSPAWEPWLSSRSGGTGRKSGGSGGMKLYDEEDREELESLENHGSVITHLLSQVRIGMDLTKVVLPTFILERRSLLEMYADFFAHPDLFVKIADIDNPKDRMLQVVRWYMSAFHAGRKSEIAKKPYNPILGEIFRCHWKIPGVSNCSTAESPLFPWAREDNLIFIAEQVSHHPPISAFYAEHYDKRISLDGYIWTKSKFLGLSIGVHMIGQAVLSVPDFEEEYIFTFPNGYGRSILTVPWVELGGKVSLTCPKSGYSANIEFHTKPFYGGKKHRITAEILAANEKKPFCSIEGEWNGVMYAKHSSGERHPTIETIETMPKQTTGACTGQLLSNGPTQLGKKNLNDDDDDGVCMNEVFVDTKRMPIIKKQVQELDKQDAMESRNLWRDVTYNLKIKNINSATEAKHLLEQRQRDEAKERKEKGFVWETKYFHEVGEHWVYDNPLLKRIPPKSSAGNTNSALQQQST
uniref:Oxysterol-binding protein n=1 Tax=Octopus bimaculoides TaxID=37653 RepID=A0A0L8GIU7_OCTBM